MLIKIVTARFLRAKIAPSPKASQHWVMSLHTSKSLAFIEHF